MMKNLFHSYQIWNTVTGNTLEVNERGDLIASRKKAIHLLHDSGGLYDSLSACLFHESDPGMIYFWELIGPAQRGLSLLFRNLEAETLFFQRLIPEYDPKNHVYAGKTYRICPDSLPLLRNIVLLKDKAP